MLDFEITKHHDQLMRTVALCSTEGDIVRGDRYITIGIRVDG